MKKTFLLLLLLAALALACQQTPVSPTQPVPEQEMDALPTQTLPESSPTPTLTATPLPTPTPLPGARIAAGDQALFDGDFEAARQAFRSAIESSNDPEIQSAGLTGLGRIETLSGNYTDALNILRAAIEGYPDSPHRPEAEFYLGQTYIAIGRPADAAQAYLNYLAFRPGMIDSYVLELRGDALSTAGDHSAALIDYQAALNNPRGQSSLPLEIKLARTYALTGDSATALVLYDDIYQRSDSEYTRAQIDLLRGQLYTALGQTEQAQAAYLDAVNQYPQAYDSYTALVELVNAGAPVDELQRGIVDYHAAQYGVALAAFDRYLNSSPSDPGRAYYYKGSTLLALDDPANAVTLFTLAIQSDPNSSAWDRAWEQKAYTQWAYLDQYAEAVQTLLDFVRLVPTHARAAEYLFDAAQIAERAGSLNQAVQLWESTAAQYPTSSYADRALFLAGITAYRQGNYESAQAILIRLQQSADNLSDRSAAMLWIGKTYQALGQSQAAQTIWQQTSQIDPTGYYSERARDLLSGRQPFAAPLNFDLGYDPQAEKAEAEAWLRQTFSLPGDLNLEAPGELASDAHLQRGLEFWRLGLYSEAVLEFELLRIAVQNDPANSYRLATYLAEIGAYRPAILAARQVLTLAGMDDLATLAAPMHFNRIRFGAYFGNLVVPIAQRYNFHPLFLWSIMRQESFFDRGISSSAGARGLMQIIPSTGQDIASRMGWPPEYRTEDLYRPLVSITLGVDYLDDQRVYMGGDLYAALAAYNGGPGNAAVWKEMAGDDPDLFLEVIRFEEPRRYIRGIYEMYTIYRRLYERTP